MPYKNVKGYIYYINTQRSQCVLTLLGSTGHGMAENQQVPCIGSTSGQDEVRLCGKAWLILETQKMTRSSEDSSSPRRA